jgi:ribosomal-protein-alanine N-acetyltransferase
MKTSLRAPTAKDYAAIASWIPDATAGLRWAGPRLPFPFSASDLPALLAMPDGGKSSYSLIDKSGNLCAFGQHWVLEPGAVHLGRIIVAPDARGRGIGRTLCQQLISAALHSTALTAVTLRAYRNNLAAVQLYTSLGFVEVEADSNEDQIFMKMPASHWREPTHFNVQ